MNTRSLKRKTKSRQMIWFIFALAIILIGIGGYSYYKKSQSSKNNKPSVATTTIGTGDIVLLGSGAGTLTSQGDISLGFKNGGKVSDVLVGLGDKVTTGQILAHLNNTLLELQYQQAQANYAALSSPSEIAKAQQAVQDDKATLATAKDTLQGLIGPDLLMAEDTANAAQESLQLAKATEVNNPSSENQQKVSNAASAFATANTRLAQAQNDYTGKYILQTFIYPVRNSKGVTQRKQLFAPSDAEISIARAAYDLATANLADAQNYLDVLTGNKTMDEVPASSVAPITDAKIALDQAKANLDAAQLISPIDGTITAISLNVGDSVGTSAVLTISNIPQPYTLDVKLDETDWDKAQIGYDANVTFDMLPNKNFPAKVIAVYPALDTSSSTSLVQVVVQLTSKIDVNLPAGATASVDVTGGKALGVTLVPTSALKETASGQYVVYLMKSGHPVEQAVDIGLQDFVNTEIKSGLKPGDVVLTNATSNN